MDIASIGGLVGGLAIIMLVMIMDGGSPAELLSHPSAIMLIFGGSLAATTISCSLDTMKKLPAYLKIAFTNKELEIEPTIESIVKMADKARREGLLALEEEAKKIQDPFLQKGIMMVVDGVDINQIRDILENNIEQMNDRHKKGIGLFALAGGFAPTIGIIGTVMGLIAVLKELENPSKLAKSIAAAFLATLWGLLSANLIYLPISAKLKLKNEEEVNYRYMILEGIVAIQAGENPRVIKDKMTAFLPPSKQGAAAEKKGSKAKAGAEKAGAQS